MRNIAKLGLSLGVFACWIGTAPVAFAHDAWIELKDGRMRAVFGHDGKIETISPAKLKAVTALDDKGSALAVKIEPGKDEIVLQTDAKPALMTLFYDNGYYTKTADGSKNLPKNEVPGAVSATHAVKYGKTILVWNETASRVQGQPLELVPQASAAPLANGRLAVQVLWAGQPLPATKVFAQVQGKEVDVLTDASGMAQVAVSSGVQRVWTSLRQPRNNDPRADADSVSANLVFQAR